MMSQHSVLTMFSIHLLSHPCSAQTLTVETKRPFASPLNFFGFSSTGVP